MKKYTKNIYDWKVNAREFREIVEGKKVRLTIWGEEGEVKADELVKIIETETVYGFGAYEQPTGRYVYAEIASPQETDKEEMWNVGIRLVSGVIESEYEKEENKEEE